jgi:hypothetical protein
MLVHVRRNKFDAMIVAVSLLLDMGSTKYLVWLLVMRRGRAARRSEQLRRRK